MIVVIEPQQFDFQCDFLRIRHRRFANAKQVSLCDTWSVEVGEHEGGGEEKGVSTYLKFEVAGVVY